MEKEIEYEDVVKVLLKRKSSVFIVLDELRALYFDIIESGDSLTKKGFCFYFLFSLIPSIMTCYIATELSFNHYFVFYIVFASFVFSSSNMVMLALPRGWRGTAFSAVFVDHPNVSEKYQYAIYLCGHYVKNIQHNKKVVTKMVSYIDGICWSSMACLNLFLIVSVLYFFGL